MTIRDISAPIHNGMHFWEGDPEPRVTRLQDHERGDEWTTSFLSICAHLGTHVDAPLHRVRGGGTVDAFDLETLVGRAYVAALPDVAHAITAEALDAAEIHVDAKRLLFKTRNGALWERDGFQKDFVGLSESGAQWVVGRGIRLVGVDYLGADVYLTETAPAHDLLLKAGVIIVEGLQLSAVAAGWYTLVCLPIKVQGADGAPARAILVDALSDSVSFGSDDASLLRVNEEER